MTTSNDDDFASKTLHFLRIFDEFANGGKLKSFVERKLIR